VRTGGCDVRVGIQVAARLPQQVGRDARDVSGVVDALWTEHPGTDRQTDRQTDSGPRDPSAEPSRAGQRWRRTECSRPWNVMPACASMRLTLSERVRWWAAKALRTSTQRAHTGGNASPLRAHSGNRKLTKSLRRRRRRRRQPSSCAVTTVNTTLQKGNTQHHQHVRTTQPPFSQRRWAPETGEGGG
jgi:hypothetical protein